MSFSLKFDKRKSFIDSLIESVIVEFVSPSKQLLDSVNYSVSSGGKRIRAMLALEFFLEFGGELDEAMANFLVAVELLHLYTLVHDDLPCMDNDDYRRGKPSNHKVFGDGLALLCGDALLNYSYELLFKGSRLAKNKEHYIEACAAFSAYAGGGGVIGGQALEFEQNRSLESQDILTVYKHKTCDLITGAIIFAAKYAGADESRIEVLREFGYHFGMAFQIRDDFLDIKEKGSVEKTTLLGVMGEQNAETQLRKSVEKAQDALKTLGIRNEFLKDLTNFAAIRQS